MATKEARNLHKDNKSIEWTRVKKILEFVPGIFFLILVILTVSYIIIQEVAGDLLGESYLPICVMAAVLTVVCLVTVWILTNVIVKEERMKTDKRIRESNKIVIQKVDRFSKQCIDGLLTTQKRLFGPYFDDISQIRQEDIMKIFCFLDAIKKYDPQGILNDQDIQKVRELLHSFVKLGASNDLCAYADMKDLKQLEQTVEANGTIDVISHNVTDNKELKNIIINNLKKGIHYNYYLYREAGLDELKRQFVENVTAWTQEVGKDTVRKQVRCWTVPPECVQMVIIIYNAHNLESESKYKTGVVVKLPKINGNVKKDYPLFFYITDHEDLLKHFKKNLDYLKQNGTEYYFCD